MNQSLLLLFDPATVNQNIFHYAEKPRKDRFDIKVTTEYESFPTYDTIYPLIPSQ